MKVFTTGQVATAGLFLGIITFAFAIVLFCCHHEAATFNKFKGEDQPEATLWDAAFADLRVESR